MPDSKRKTIIESIREYVRMYPDIDNRKINIDRLGNGMEYSIDPIGADNTYECLIPIAMHNGGSAGTQARIYIKNGGVYISGTDSASFVMIASTAYFS